MYKFIKLCLKAGPTGVSTGSSVLVLHPSRWLHFLPRGIMEALTGSASQKEGGTGKEKPPKWRCLHHHHQGAQEMRL